MKSAWLILSALIAGMLLGIGVELVSPAAGTASLPWIEPIGLLWLNALKMTIVPLVVALLITGITATADAARAGKLASRAVLTFLAAIVLIGALGALAQGGIYGNVHVVTGLLLTIPAILGVILGTAIQQRIPQKAVSYLFAALLVAIAIELILK